MVESWSRDPVLPCDWLQVDVLLSRDLDSRVSAREVAAVREWLGSGRAVHSMRDHPTHWVPMLGSAWAARLDTPGARARWAETWRTILGGQDSLATSLVYADRWDTALHGRFCPLAGWCRLCGVAGRTTAWTRRCWSCTCGTTGPAGTRSCTTATGQTTDCSDCIISSSVCGNVDPQVQGPRQQPLPRRPHPRLPHPQGEHHQQLRERRGEL